MAEGLSDESDSSELIMSERDELSFNCNQCGCDEYISDLSYQYLLFTRDNLIYGYDTLWCFECMKAFKKEWNAPDLVVKSKPTEEILIQLHCLKRKNKIRKLKTNKKIKKN